MSPFRKTYRDELDHRADGRNFLPGRSVLSGEASHQKVKRLEEPHPARRVDHVEPVHATVAQERTSYYGTALVKEPVWVWSVPTYFFVGGVAGAAGTLAGAVQLLGDPELRPFVRKLRWIATASGAVSSGLLIYDLGRPLRFLNMLRVFRPTSPMSMGAWALATLAPLATGSALLSEGPRPLRALGDLAGIGAAIIAAPFAGYTAVLIGNTAVPVWQGAHRSLPVVFVTSAMASLASVVELLDVGERERGIARRFGMIGRVGELASTAWMKRELALPELRKPLEEGRAGRLLKVGRATTVASLALSLLPSRFRTAHRLGGVLGTVSVLALKWGVFLAGRPSAKDPHATIQMQRQGRGAAQVGRASELVQLKIEGRPLPAAGV